MFILMILMSALVENVEGYIFSMIFRRAKTVLILMVIKVTSQTTPALRIRGIIPAELHMKAVYTTKQHHCCYTAFTSHDDN